MPTELHIELLDAAGRVHDSRLLRFDDASFKENISWVERWTKELPIEHAPPPPPPPAIITRKNWNGETFALTFDHADGDDDSVREYWRLEGLAAWSELEQVFPREHCQHEWDCCGRWYQFYGIQLENGLVRRDLHRNV